MIDVRQFVQEELKSVGVVLGAASLDVLLLTHGLYSADEITEYALGEVATKAKTAILNGLSKILAMPDIQEGDLSIKYDRAAIATYCNALRTELGIVDTTAPTVTNASDRW